ncbi:MAG: SusC/RagA family TonB-linked outer membrane protein [Balneolaceae bacterium]|nr:SusC/RagA family TonB-linked outer membrane protein [Balneolaceae bacterium]
MKYKLLTMLVCACFVSLNAFAQVNITGTVTDAENGELLPGVNVVIQQLQRGDATNVDGEFAINNVETGTYTLVVTFIGYNRYQQTIEVGNTDLNLSVELVPSVTALDDVVVTAFGVQREQRSLGYASQSVSSQDIMNTRETNFVNTLQGKMAGVEITGSSGSLGGSSRIVLRGMSSLTGENQPLFIVDGVYIDNSNFDPGGEFGQGADYGNAAMDINPSDIESITVLKGPNAAALYGSRAANGAIVITTKDGRTSQEGLGVTVNSMVTFEDILILPSMQNEYGQGQQGQFEWVDGRGGGVFDGGDESWGPPLDGRMVPQWPDGSPREWIARPDNVRDYFDTGVSFNNNVSVAGNYDQANFRFSFTDLRQDGMFPAESLDRNTVGLNAGVQLSEDLRVDARANYFKLIGRNRPSVGYAGDNPMQQLTQWYGRQLDTQLLRENYIDEAGRPINWNYNYFDNPFWIQYMNGNRQERDRFLGNVTSRYNVSDWISLSGMVGTDTYTERRQDWTAVFSVTDPDGRYYEDVRYVNELTANFMAEFEQNITPDFYVSGRVGTEVQTRRYRMNSAEAPGLSVPYVYSISNSSVRPNVNDRKENKRINSLFASATFGFRDYIYLDVTGRNDWSSTLPVENNSYFYPSASLSFVFTDAFNITSNWLTYGKLRGGWTKVGNDTDPYQLQAVFNAASPFGDTPSYSLSNTIPNIELEPESIYSVELGADLRFLQNRLGLDVTLYNQRTENQILAADISRASGYTSQYINAGEIQNRGIEIALSGAPVQTSRFSWNVNVNWAKNQNEVIELIDGLDAFIHYSSWDVRSESRPGMAVGTLFGSGFMRDDDGNIIVNDLGIPMVDSELRPFGSYQADWTGGIMNTFNYRGLEFSFLIDAKYGGKLTSTTYMFGRYTGILEETLEGREGGLVFDGGRWANGAVKQDGTPNDIVVDAQTFNERTFFGNAESHIFDATYVKLRELRLGYSLPANWLANFPLNSVDVALTGRNLWIIHKEAPHIDPETAFNSGNIQGFESNQFPSTRSIGFNVRFTL